MNPRILSTARLASALAALLATPFVHAFTLTWDANGTGALQTDGLGVWLSANQWRDCVNSTGGNGADQREEYPSAQISISNSQHCLRPCDSGLRQFFQGSLALAPRSISNVQMKKLISITKA